MRYGKKQLEVIESARKVLIEYPWYKGVCVDQLPFEEGIDDSNFNYHVENIVNDTMYWDKD